jgi:hypothetical protein
MSNTSTTSTANAQSLGNQAVAVAEQQINKPYVYGATGPNSFDCSGLMYYSYLQCNPSINVGRDTTAQWNNQTTLYTVFDAFNAQGKTLSQNDLQEGDLLLYFQPGNSGPNAHVKMYVGGGQTIEAPYTGAVVTYNPVDLVGDTAEPFHGVKRTTGSTGGGTAGGAGPGGSNSNQGSGNNNNASNTGLTASQMQSMAKTIGALKDPRSNLPFSASFQGQVFSGSSGSFKVGLPGQTQLYMPATQIVRGGMMELVAKQFKCYFMMNPQQISVDAGINTSQLSPFQQDPNVWQSGGYWATNQTVTFTVYFNRMYEVWQGNVQGPSQEGCRWDTRALERLMGIFDAVANNGGAVGLGNNGWGEWPASMMPLQVAFGGPNALQFQGVIASFDYTYTIFDANMIPVEAYADIQVMRVYNPQSSGADLTTSLVTSTGQKGVTNLPGKQPFTR